MIFVTLVILLTVLIYFIVSSSKRVNKYAICFLCATYSKQFINYIQSAYLKDNNNSYDIYVCIDKVDTIDEIPPRNIHLIALDSTIVERAGFRGSVLYFLDRACSRDKALYYFSTVNRNVYDCVWFIEDDVYASNPLSIIRKLDERYGPDVDLLVKSHDTHLTTKPDINVWHWKLIDGKIGLPWACSMICVVRVSRQLLSKIADFAGSRRVLMLDEALFNTLCAHHRLKVETPAEFEYITYLPQLLPATRNRTDRFYHPMKAFWKK